MESTRFRVLWVVVMLFAWVGCTSKVERDWQATSDANSIDRYQSFVADHPTSEHAAEARGRIYELAYQEARNADSVEAFDAFLSQHPTGAHGDEVRTLLDARSFERSKTANTLKAFEDYLAKFPNGQFAAEARASAERLRPYRGEIEVTLVPLDYTFARMDVIWSLKSGDNVYEVEFLPSTTFVGVANFEKPLNISPPNGTYEITGDLEKGSRLRAAAGTLKATTVTLVSPSVEKRGAKLGM